MPKSLTLPVVCVFVVFNVYPGYFFVWIQAQGLLFGLYFLGKGSGRFHVTIVLQELQNLARCLSVHVVIIALGSSIWLTNC